MKMSSPSRLKSQLTAMSLQSFPLPKLTQLPSICIASANTLNQWMEVPFDAKMSRTCKRPLCKQTLSPLHALALGVGTGVLGVSVLATQVNSITAALGLFNIGLYAGVYTPLKRKSEWNTWIGAVVGGIPPM